MTRRWLSLKEATHYSRIGKDRLKALARQGIVKGAPDPDNRRGDWIFDLHSLDSYRNFWYWSHGRNADCNIHYYKRRRLMRAHLAPTKEISMRNHAVVKRTFNPLVAGSNPARPTNKCKGLSALTRIAPFAFLARFGQIRLLLRPLCTLCLLVMIACPAHADEWTQADTAREVAYLALHVADWGQTLDIADHPEKWHEHNPILGSHPSRGEVNAYFIATGLLHPVVSYGLRKYAPDGWVQAWQYGTIGIELYCVGNNMKLGIGFGF